MNTPTTVRPFKSEDGETVVRLNMDGSALLELQDEEGFNWAKTTIPKEAVDYLITSAVIEARLKDMERIEKAYKPSKVLTGTNDLDQPIYQLFSAEDNLKSEISLILSQCTELSSKEGVK